MLKKGATTLGKHMLNGSSKVGDVTNHFFDRHGMKTNRSSGRDTEKRPE